MPYKVLSPVSCGQLFKIGDTIPDGTLSDRDAIALIKCGAIEEPPSATAKEILESSPVAIANPAPPKTDSPLAIFTGIISDPAKVLEYVNSADQAGLERIKKVGTSTAKAMIAHGKFGSIDELKELVGNVDWDTIEIV